MRFRLWIEMNQVGLESLLNPIGQCYMIGAEKERKIAPNVSVYVSPHGSYRYVYLNDDQIISAMQVVSQKKGQAHVAQVFTHPDYRKQGLATQLYQAIQRDFQNVTYSDDRSAAGDGLAQSLGYESSRKDQK